MVTTDIIAIGAGFISFFALIVSILSYRISLKNLKNSEKEIREKMLGIKPYLIDSFSFTLEEMDFYEFAISMTNLSSQTQSFKNVELHIECIHENGRISKAISVPVTNVNPPNTAANYKELPIPLNIQPKESLSGWIAFKKPKLDFTVVKIKEYKIVGEGSRGEIELVRTYLMRSLQSE